MTKQFLHLDHTLLKEIVKRGSGLTISYEEDRYGTTMAACANGDEEPVAGSFQLWGAGQSSRITLLKTSYHEMVPVSESSEPHTNEVWWDVVEDRGELPASDMIEVTSDFTDRSDGAGDWFVLVKQDGSNRFNHVSDASLLTYQDAYNRAATYNPNQQATVFRRVK